MQPYEIALTRISNSGTSEGVKKGWETKHGNQPGKTKPFTQGAESKAKMIAKLKEEQAARTERMKQRLKELYVKEPDSEYAEIMWGDALRQQGVDTKGLRPDKVANSGTSEGVKKAWESRHHGIHPELRLIQKAHPHHIDEHAESASKAANAATNWSHSASDAALGFDDYRSHDDAMDAHSDAIEKHGEALKAHADLAVASAGDDEKFEHHMKQVKAHSDAIGKHKQSFVGHSLAQTGNIEIPEIVKKANAETAGTMHHPDPKSHHRAADLHEKAAETVKDQFPHAAEAHKKQAANHRSQV